MVLAPKFEADAQVGGVNSSAPISGLLASRTAQSTSVVTAAKTAPAASRFDIFVELLGLRCRSVGGVATQTKTGVIFFDKASLDDVAFQLPAPVTAV